jgi:hypothetical protein
VGEYQDASAERTNMGRVERLTQEQNGGRWLCRVVRGWRSTSTVEGFSRGAQRVLLKKIEDRLADKHSNILENLNKAKDLYWALIKGEIPRDIDTRKQYTFDELIAVVRPCDTAPTRDKSIDSIDKSFQDYTSGRRK